MNHKKALKKILKWAGSLLLSSLFTAPVIFILIICGVVIALFGKSSTSSGDVSFSETVSVSETGSCRLRVFFKCRIYRYSNCGNFGKSGMGITIGLQLFYPVKKRRNCNGNRAMDYLWWDK